MFTDEDLKELKRKLNEWPDIDVCNYFDTDEEIRAFLARLEAAETIVCLFEDKVPLGKLDKDALEAWRKAAGK
jgi:hypothetical protein